MKTVNEINFGIQRKIVANMTTESWETIPHAVYNYEPDVTAFMQEYKKLNLDRKDTAKITVNTLMLKVITEGLKAAPIMNSHIEYKRRLVRGTIKVFEDINISMPMLLPSGEMMTINLHNFESKNLDEMTEYIADVSKRLEKTDMNEAMFEVSLDNTFKALRRGKVLQTAFRLIGSKTGKHRVKTLSGKAKREYLSIPETERITKSDIEQGTVTITNTASVYRGQTSGVGFLEIIPPQICAFAIGAAQDKPVVVTAENGEKSIEIRQVLPLCIAFDHRALDFGDILPFIKRLDDIFENPAQIHSWRSART